MVERFRVRIDADHVVRLWGELDHAEATALAEVAASSVDTQRELVVDLTDLTFIDSAGIGVIVETARLTDGDVLLRGPRPAVRRVLDVTGIVGTTGIKLEQ